MPNLSMFAVLALDGGELVLVVTVIIVLFGSRRIPDFARGLGEGMNLLRNAVSELDQEAHDAGESLGGIYGKHAAQALASDNQVAELYDPAVLHKQNRNRPATWRLKFRSWLRLWQRVWHIVFKRRG